MRPGEIARLVTQEARRIRKRHPDLEQFVSTGVEDGGRLVVRRSDWPEGVTISVPVTEPGHIAAAGASVLVGYDNARRNRPFIKSVVALGRGVAASSGGGGGTLVLALWPDCTGSPYCNRGPLLTCAAPQWDGGLTVVGDLPRFYYEDALHEEVAEGEDPPQWADTFSFEGVTLLDSHPSTSLPRVAAMVSLLDGTGGSLIGYQLREWELSESTWTLTGEWIHITDDPTGSLAPNDGQQRRNGYLFYDKVSDTYTLAAHDGLLLCTRANEPTPNRCAWAHSYGDMPGNSGVSVAGGYAIAGAYRGYDAAFDAPEDCAVDLYYRHTDGHWAHLEQVVLGDKLSGCDYVEACGYWNPSEETTENTRWAFMGNEWYVWVCGRAGDPGPSDRPTAAKAALLAIRAATGAVRTVYEYNAPLELLVPYEELLDTLIEQLVYQSSHHPGNWVDFGFPLGYVDEGGANGWSTGQIFAYGEFSGIPEEDIPENLGRGEPGDPIGFVQRVIRASGLDDSEEPTVAPDCQRLECGGTEDASFPRGVVDAAESRFYLAVQHRSWMAGSTPYYIPTVAEGDYEYLGNYEDFPAGTIPGVDDFWVRVWSFEAESAGAVGYGGDAGLVVRPIIHKFSSNALLDSLDLTRDFVRTESGRTYHDLRSPRIHEMAVAGDYLWVLATDWWEDESEDSMGQFLTLILVSKATMAEVHRLNLEPEEDRVWLESAGRPQLMAGVDGAGPWAQVQAWWTGSPSTSVAQELRVVDGEVVMAARFEESFSENYPERLSEACNLAVSPGKQFWIERAFDSTFSLRVRQE